MPGRLITLAVAALTVLLVSTNAAAAPVIVENRTMHAAKLEAVKELRSAVDALGDRDDAAGLLSMLEQIDRDTKIDAAVRENLLETTLLALSRTTPDPAARAAVNRYLNHPVDAYVRLGDERGQPTVPLYDPRAAAALTIRAWDTAAATKSVTIALRASLWQPGDYMQPPRDMSLEAWQAGTRRAFESVEPRFVAVMKPALLEWRGVSDGIDALVFVVANRLGDAEMYEAIITQGDASYAREAISTVQQSLNFGDATTLLINATARPELASIAILELGAHFSNDKEIRSWLLDRLGNPTDGASAALALARAADDEILSGIQDVILSDAAEMTKLRAALVLRISGSVAAQSLRNDLLSRTLSSKKLREALQ